MDMVLYSLLKSKIAKSLMGISTIKLDTTTNKHWIIETTSNDTFRVAIPNAVDNPELLNKFSLDADGNLLFDGEQIGGGVIEEDIIANIGAGAVSVGDKIKKDTTVTELAKQIFIQKLAPSVTFTATISDGDPYSTIREKGISVDVTQIKATVTKRSNNIKSVIWSDAVSYTEPSVSVNTATYSKSKSNISETETFTVTATDEKGLVGKGSLTLTFVDPMRKLVIDGTLDINTVTEAEVLACDKLLNIKETFTDTYTVSGKKIGLAYPSSYGDLTGIWDVANNMNIISGFKKNTIDITTASGVVSYNIYLGGSNSVVSDCKIKYEW